MNEEFAKKVRTAAIAGWWTILIGYIVVTIQWLGYMCVMNTHPQWLLNLWGGADVQWATMQTTWLWFLGIFKMIIGVMLLITIWLSLWARGLRKSGQ